MYSVLPSFIIGFHGCDKSVADKVLSGKNPLRKSNNSYDWLGHGIYFWENNPQRALEYAESLKANPTRCKEKITKPAVIGAIISLGHCLNLLDSKYLKHVKELTICFGWQAKPQIRSCLKTKTSGKARTCCCDRWTVWLLKRSIECEKN